MTQTADEFGEELADFVRRVGELRTARSQGAGEQLTVLDAALFELQHVAEQLWPRYEQFVTGAGTAGGSPGDRQERQLLKALFQRMPLPVFLVDRETVVRRLNFAATGLTGTRAGYATGRPLAALLMPGDRGAFRSQAAAVARGDGDRGLTVRLQQRPEEPLLATLTALRPPDEPHPAVLVVLQPGISRATAAAPPPELPDLGESTRHAELMDLIDTMAGALLSLAPGERGEILETAARVLCGRFAQWVVADLVDGGLRRTSVLGPAARESTALRRLVAAQDPASCPLVAEAARAGTTSLQVQPEDTDGFGHDPAGAPVLALADVTSLLCVPLGAPGPVQGVLTLFRTGSAPPFSMAEGHAMDVMSRHTALAMRRPAGAGDDRAEPGPEEPGPAAECSSG